MASTPSLPVELSKDGVTRTASTPTEYVDLLARGFGSHREDPELSAAEKRRITREQKAAEKTSHDGPEETVGTNPS